MTSRSRNFITAIVAGMVFMGVVAFVFSGKSEGFDLAVQNWFFSLRSPILNAVVVPFSYSGNWQVVVPICLLMLVFKKTRFSYGIPMAVTSITSSLFYEFLKHIFCRLRPDRSVMILLEKGYSFPSGHSQNSLAIWSMLLCLMLYYYSTGGQSIPFYKNTPHPAELYPKTAKGMGIWIIALGLYTMFIGLSRIFVGVHWPTDILGGWSMGVLMLSLMRIVFFTPKDE